jgi:hypothetical protein
MLLIGPIQKTLNDREGTILFHFETHPKKKIKEKESGFNIVKFWKDSKSR